MARMYLPVKVSPLRLMGFLAAMSLVAADPLNVTSSAGNSSSLAYTTYHSPDPSILSTNASTNPDPDSLSLGGTANLSATTTNLTTKSDPFDFVQCDPIYGVDLVPDSCRDVLKNMFDVRIPKSLAFVRPWGTGGRIAATRLVVPVEYKDQDTRPNCLITVDLAGPVWDSSTVRLLSSTLRSLANEVIDSCVAGGGGMGRGFGGYGTYDLRDTGNSLAGSKDRGKSFDAPSFLTLSVTNPSTPNYRPGDTDPAVIQPLMDIRAYWREQAWTDKDKNDITLVLKQLQYSRHVMDPGRPRTWWDDDGWKESAAANVGYECQRELGLLTEFDRDCKEASAMFIRAGEVTIQAGKGVELGRGQCVFRAEVTHLDATVTWDSLRSVVNGLLSRCVEDSEAPGVGGIATVKGGGGEAGPSRPIPGYHWPDNLVVRMVRAGLRGTPGGGGEGGNVEEITAAASGSVATS